MLKVCLCTDDASDQYLYADGAPCVAHRINFSDMHASPQRKLQTFLGTASDLACSSSYEL